jgi:transcriptional regulator with XRE-family HTH domain
MPSNININSLFIKLVGRQVREHRLAAGLTQEQLSTASGIFRTYLSRIESGMANPSVSVLSAIASALKVQVSNLVQAAPHVGEDCSMDKRRKVKALPAT